MVKLHLLYQDSIFIFRVKKFLLLQNFLLYLTDDLLEAIKLQEGMTKALFNDVHTELKFLHRKHRFKYWSIRHFPNIKIVY